MGGGGQTRTEYIQPPTYQGPPPETEADKQFRVDQQAKMDALNQGYQKSLDAMKGQYEQQSQNSASVLKTLQDSVAAQQQQAAQTKAELAQANASSKSQLELLTATRDRQVAQTTDANTAATNDATSMFGRMSRRRVARATRY